ncbi:MAG: Ribulose-phosphate 3-epimerase, partial [uncultured Microvirga sp.]
GPSPAHRPLDPRRGFRQARRRGARGRRGRRRLDPSRRHGRAFRAEHLLRPGGRGRDPRLDPKTARRASHDRAGRPLSRGLRESGRRPHHGSCRGGAASAPFAAGDPRARQAGRRRDQPGHPGERGRARARPRRSRALHERQPRLWRPDLHRGHLRQDPADPRHGGRACDRHRGGWRDHARDGAARGRGRRECARGGFCGVPGRSRGLCGRDRRLARRRRANPRRMGL